MSLSASAAPIEWVTVGNPGNAGEVIGGGMSVWPAATVGAVDYVYRIGKYEVTNAQYANFLNEVDALGSNALGLYSAAMGYDPRGGINYNSLAANGAKYSVKSGQANQPVVFVDWYDAIRFTNWVQSGGTEDGAYTLLGGTPVPSNAATITRNPDATVFLPTESEWYKAAYHKNDGVTGNFWDYATRTDTPTYSDSPLALYTPDPSNTANIVRVDDPLPVGYNNGFALTGTTDFDWNTNYLTDVGAYGLAVGPYGTFDQGGNVKEWNETLIIDTNGMHRGVSGGGWSDGSDAAFVRFFTNPLDPDDLNWNIGFRLGGYFSSVDPGPGNGEWQIPEPSSLVLASLGALILKRRRRK